jgi:hypothetical protein
MRELRRREIDEQPPTTWRWWGLAFSPIHRGGPADVVYSRYALLHLPNFGKVMAVHTEHNSLSKPPTTPTKASQIMNKAGRCPPGWQGCR